MKKVIYRYREHHPPHDFSEWKVVYLLKEHKNTKLIWHWYRFPFGKYVHNNAIGERIEDL